MGLVQTRHSSSPHLQELKLGGKELDALVPHWECFALTEEQFLHSTAPLFVEKEASSLHFRELDDDGNGLVDRMELWGF